MLSGKVENHGHIAITVAPCPILSYVVGIFEVDHHPMLMADRRIWQVAGAGKLKSSS